jgi:predicted nuclease of predicted toxin-antitoxin system
MNFYLDEDSAKAALIRVLENNGHDVLSASGARMLGTEDPEQFAYAIRHNRVLVTRNHDHFEALPALILEARGHHPGVLAICSDNDPRRDLTPRGIATAIGKLLASGIDLADNFLFSTSGDELAPYSARGGFALRHLFANRLADLRRFARTALQRLFHCVAAHHVAGHV